MSIPGSRAQGLFAESGIEVIVGAPVAPPEDLAAAREAIKRNCFDAFAARKIAGWANGEPSDEQ